MRGKPIQRDLQHQLAGATRPAEIPFSDGEASGFGHFISSADGNYMLVPPDHGAQARPLPAPDWIAPVVMLIRYL